MKEEKDEFEFLKGGASIDARNGEDKTKTVCREITQLMGSKHIAFLLGAGCSSLKQDGIEIGIPSMKPLVENFVEGLDAENSWSMCKSDRGQLVKNLGIKLDEGSGNLEDLLQKLYAAKLLVCEGQSCFPNELPKLISETIQKVELFLFEKVNIDLAKKKHIPLLKLYQSFYRRLFFRDRTQPRPWVFTTNYDLLNEFAMDGLGIHYSNGFMGGLTRYFNSTSFKITLARELDVSSNQWVAEDNFVYLCKLHGSINWTTDTGDKLWPFRETLVPHYDKGQRLLIFPTPAKDGETLGSPYSDLFREFQGRIVREQSVLITIGYSFSDEHINSIIYQALKIPSFRLVIFAAIDSGENIAMLRDLGDPRIWLIGSKSSDGEKFHYFESVVNKFLPDQPEENAEKALKRLGELLMRGGIRDGE